MTRDFDSNSRDALVAQRTGRLALMLGLTCLATACGVDKELLASAKAHKCELEKLAAKAEKDPGDAEVQKQIKQRTGLLTAVLDTADDRSALQDALAKETCE